MWQSDKLLQASSVVILHVTTPTECVCSSLNLTLETQSHTQTSSEDEKRTSLHSRVLWHRCCVILLSLYCICTLSTHYASLEYSPVALRAIFAGCWIQAGTLFMHLHLAFPFPQSFKLASCSIAITYSFIKIIMDSRRFACLLSWRGASRSCGWLLHFGA
jgi:hypothetical protein